MELYLQFGHGMMSMSEELIRDWNGGLVILSPRDLELNQMTSFSTKISSINGKIVIDPQFYLPKSDHSRLVSHSFWPSNYQTALFNKVDINRMLKTLKDQYNDPLNSEFFILPGLMTSIVNEDWYNYNSIVIEESKNLISDKDLYLTLCFSKEVMISEENIHLAIEYLDNWNIEGCYVVAEPPSNEYLVSDPNWLVNLMDLTSGIKLQNKKVIVGYSNHQMLMLALSKVDAIASGNWLNVRSFNKNRFNNPDDSVSRRSKWYYCPHALSEYQVVFLDIANRQGALQDLRTDLSFGSNYSNILFSGAQPTTVNYGERDSFKHYLHCLRYQASNSLKQTYSLTKEGLRIQLEAARMLTDNFNQIGITGRNRDFGNVIDYNLSAISVFDNIRGLVQSHNWNSI